VDLHTERYFAVADDASLDYDAKLDAYLALADEYFETAKYNEWCASYLSHFDEQLVEWVSGDDFDRILCETLAATYPAHEQAKFLAHFRGLVGLWVTDQTR
jgi:hypothetical protein